MSQQATELHLAEAYQKRIEASSAKDTNTAISPRDTGPPLVASPQAIVTDNNLDVVSRQQNIVIEGVSKVEFPISGAPEQTTNQQQESIYPCESNIEHPASAVASPPASSDDLDNQQQQFYQVSRINYKPTLHL